MGAGASGFSGSLDEYFTTHSSFKLSIPQFFFRTLRLRISLLQIFFFRKLYDSVKPNLLMVFIMDNDLKVLYELLKKSFSEQTARQPLSLNKVKQNYKCNVSWLLFCCCDQIL